MKILFSLGEWWNDDPFRIGIRYCPEDEFDPKSQPVTTLVFSALPDELTKGATVRLPPTWDRDRVRFWGYRYDWARGAPMYSFGLWYFGIFFYNPRGLDWSLMYWLTGQGDKPPERT